MRNWILNICPLLIQNNVKIYVFYREEFIDHKKHKEIELINISKFGTSEILCEIKRINPNLFLLFGYRSFFELLLVRMCNYLNIQVTYIQHGMISLKYVSFWSRIRSITLLTSIKNYLHYTKIFFQFIILSRENLLHELDVFIKALFLTDYKNVGFNQFLLFSQDAYAVHKKIFSYDEISVKIIGYPVFLNSTDIDSQVLVNNPQRLKILYFHENFIQMNLTKISYNQEINYITEIAKISKKYGYDFAIQLHPMESIEKYTSLCKNQEVKMYQESRLDVLVREFSIVVGHSSTALFVPIVLGIPLITLKYPYCTFIVNTFDDVALSANSLQEYENLLNNPGILSSKLTRYNNYKKMHLGTLNSYEDYSIAILTSLK